MKYIGALVEVGVIALFFVLVGLAGEGIGWAQCALVAMAFGLMIALRGDDHAVD